MAIGSSNGFMSGSSGGVFGGSNGGGGLSPFGFSTGNPNVWGGWNNGGTLTPRIPPPPVDPFLPNPGIFGSPGPSLTPNGWKPDIPNWPPWIVVPPHPSGIGEGAPPGGGGDGGDGGDGGGGGSDGGFFNSGVDIGGLFPRGASSDSLSNILKILYRNNPGTFTDTLMAIARG